jgi:hypothetical protein
MDRSGDKEQIGREKSYPGIAGTKICKILKICEDP